MSEQQNTGGSIIRLMMGLLVAGVVGVVGGGYALWSYMAAPQTDPSNVNLTRLGGTSQVNAQEQPDYRDRLRESNALGAKAAASENKSFIASIPLQQDVVTPKQPAPVAPTAPFARSAPTQRTQSSGRTEDQEKACRGLAAKIAVGLPGETLRQEVLYSWLLRVAAKKLQIHPLPESL